MVPSSLPFDADLLYIIQDVLKIDTDQKPLHQIPAAIIHFGIETWYEFKMCCDPYDIPSWTYPIYGNFPTYCTYLDNVSVAKLQFILNYIEKRRNNNGADFDDAKSYKADAFEVYHQASWEVHRELLHAHQQARRIAYAAAIAQGNTPATAAITAAAVQFDTSPAAVCNSTQALVELKIVMTTPS